VERLRRRSEFRAAAAGMRASGNSFVLQARRRDDEKAPRVGFTVSKQVGNAVERNRVRRRLREIVRLSAAGRAEGEAAGARLRPGHDYVLIGRRAALGAPFVDMVRELEAALGRIHQPQRRGTGGARRRPLHETGSPSPPDRRRRKHAAGLREESPETPANAPNAPRES